MTAAVSREQRHTRGNRCAICDGADGDTRGKQKRCSGFISTDGEYIHCSREELAGAIVANNAGLYAHRAHGPCNCGQTHGADRVRLVEGPEATYDYLDEGGRLLFQVVRKAGKKFLQRRPDGAGGWVWSLGDTRRVLYRLPQVVAASTALPVYVVEGEKDVDSLVRHGQVATCNPGGVGKWSRVADLAREVLSGRDVVVIADTDDVGRKHAIEIAESLRDVAKSVVVCEPPAPSKDVTDLLVSGGSLEALIPMPSAGAAARVLRRPGDRVRALAGLGPVVRLPTGIPTLDDSCRGGLPSRRFVVVGGAPGAGKTTLATNWAWRWAKAGIPVGMLAIDEGPEGAIDRIAQLEGLSPDKLEERDPSTIARLAETFDASALILVDGDDAAGTIEGVAELVVKAAAGGLGVLIVDSIQTVRAAGTDTVDSPRERVDAVVRALKAARDRGLLVIATCELARGAYRSRNVAEAINDLAAFKESGGIEYAAQTALVLRSVADETALVDVTVPKNRANRRVPFRLHLDHATTLFTETELPDPPPNSGDRRKGASTENMRRAVVDAVRGNSRRSARDIARGVRESGLKVSNVEIHDVIKCMQLEGALARVEAGCFGIVVPPESGGRDGQE